VIAREVRVTLVDFLEAADCRSGVGEGLGRHKLWDNRLSAGRKERLMMPSLRAAMRYSSCVFRERYTHLTTM
jgi:hypothetical protein